MLVSYFGLPTSFLSALRAIDSMGKRPLDQGSTSRKRSTLTCLATEQTPQIRTGARSTPTRPATEQTPEIPSDAEATMHDPKSTPVLRRCDSAVEPDDAIEHIGYAANSLPIVSPVPRPMYLIQVFVMRFRIQNICSLYGDRLVNIT